jgi:CubicO group peptidase (beta-lactamase class C family)
MEEVDQNEVAVPSRSAPVAFKNVGVIRTHRTSSTGTQGDLVGEIIRRITGKTLKEFVREEIAAPLGADIQIGARAEDDDRIAELVPPPPLDVPLDAVPEDHPMRQTFSAPRRASRRRPELQRSGLSGARSVSTTRATRGARFLVGSTASTGLSSFMRRSVIVWPDPTRTRGVPLHASVRVRSCDANHRWPGATRRRVASFAAIPPYLANMRR